MNKFVFVCPMYNASKTLSRMLHSVFGQGYQNWRIILIDDVSDAIQRDRCEAMISYEFPDDGRVTFIKNDIKRWETYNVLKGIKLCADEDIVCRLDADDCLSDLDALSFLDEAYKHNDVQAVWTAHRWNATDRNISGPMNSDADPYKHPWVSSHLKTFRKKLLNNVPYENFLNMDGDLVKRAGDQAVYLPVLHNAGNKRGFLPRVLYHYHIDEKNGAVYQTEDAAFQRQEAEYLRARGYIPVGSPWEFAII